MTSSSALPQDLQGSRVLWSSVLSELAAVRGRGQLPHVCAKQSTEGVIMRVVGGLILGVGLLLLVSVSWATPSVTLSIANPQLLSTRRPELGAWLYLGWLSCLLLLLGRALLWSQCPANKTSPVPLRAPRIARTTAVHKVGHSLCFGSVSRWPAQTTLSVYTVSVSL